MNTKYNLYVIACKSGKYFIYCSTEKSEEDIRFHTKILYDFFKNNEMIHVVKKIENIKLNDVDNHVKKYMCKYGIENVRGGTYSEEELPDYMLQTLHDEMKTIHHEIIHNEEIINEIFENYEEDKQLSKNDLQKKIENCKKEIKKYYINFLKCKNMKIFMKDNKLYYVSREFLKELNWVRQNILEYDFLSTKNAEEKNRYKNFINVIKHIIHMFINYYKEKLDVYDDNLIFKNFMDEENIVFVKHPEFIFDNYFYHHGASIDSSKIIKAIHILQIIENICTYMINRIEELQFDVVSVDINELSKQLNTRIKYYNELYNQL